MNILDFGCGNGVMLPTLAKHFSSVTAYDKYPDAARELTVKLKLNNVEVRRASFAGYVPFRDKQFDVVWASSVLEHIKNLDLVTYQLYRVSRPGGQLLFLSPSEDWRYRLGRKLFGLEKPKDHYWTGEQIHQVLCRYFTCEVKKTWPPLLGTYVMGRYRK